MTLQDPSTPSDASIQSQSSTLPTFPHESTHEPKPYDLSVPPLLPTDTATLSSNTSSPKSKINEVSITGNTVKPDTSPVIAETTTLLKNERPDDLPPTQALSPSPHTKLSPPIDASNKQPTKHDSVMDHAKQILLDQLMDVFMKDLKNRVVGPCIYDFLNPALFKRAMEQQSISRKGSESKTTATDDDDTMGTTTSISNSHAQESSPQPSSPSMKLNGIESANTDRATAIKTEPMNTHIVTTTSSHSMNGAIKVEDDSLFSLPKPKDNIAEGALPSLNKLPRFKKRTSSSKPPPPPSNNMYESISNGLSHSRQRLYSPKYSDEDMDDASMVYGQRYSVGSKGRLQKRKQSSTSSPPPSSNGTRIPVRPATVEVEEQSGTTFFSSSEEGEYQSGASVASSDQETDIKDSPATANNKGQKRSMKTTLERKKPRRLRDYLSDEENEFDQEVHEAFLRRLHQEQEGNDASDDDQPDIKHGDPSTTKGDWRNGAHLDDDDGDDDYDNSDDAFDRPYNKRKRIKQQQKQKASTAKKKHRLVGSAEQPLNDRATLKLPDPTIDIGGGTTSDDDNNDGDDDDDMRVTGKRKRQTWRSEDKTAKEEEDAFDQEAYEQMLLAPDSSDDDEWLDNKDGEPAGQDAAGQDAATAAATVLDVHPDWDPFRKVQDAEDFGFLRLAILEKLGLGAAIPETNDTTNGGGGCARSRGYYVISDAEKATYLPKNMAVLDAASLGASGRLSSSRTNRVNNRRFVVGMVMQKKAMADSDILKFNQLKGRKKQLRFAKSPIHDWGLYAEEHIDANDMVIEYVGEVIRQQVAEEREKTYERCGIGSSYLFRVDDDIVIDATKKGSIARFINHCCSVSLKKEEEEEDRSYLLLFLFFPPISSLTVAQKSSPSTSIKRSSFTPTVTSNPVKKSPMITSSLWKPIKYLVFVEASSAKALSIDGATPFSYSLNTL